MAAQNLKPAKNTRPHHGVAGPGKFNQFNTINWYQQTWHTIEFSNNRHMRILPKQFIISEFFCFAFLRCDVYSLFHSFPLCKSGIFSRNSLCRVNPPSKIRSISFLRLALESLLLFCWGVVTTQRRRLRRHYTLLPRSANRSGEERGHGFYNAETSTVARFFFPRRSSRYRPWSSSLGAMTASGSEIFALFT
ncbi:MAG: hypothetical protein JWN05_3328 [Arthrobacter sp.]|nr:hypothetical protein [Arthrobacter sp.]